MPGKIAASLNLNNVNWAGLVLGRLLQGIAEDGYKLRLSIDLAKKAVDVDLVKKEKTS